MILDAFQIFWVIIWILGTIVATIFSMALIIDWFDSFTSSTDQLIWGVGLGVGSVLSFSFMLAALQQ